MRVAGGLTTIAAAALLITVMACSPSVKVPAGTGETTSDPVAALDQAIANGQQRLRFREDRGYLDAVLEALDVPAESQVLVYSQTSRQRELIGAANPRAIYFNDTTAVGWVPGAADLELITFSTTERGAVFYTLPQQVTARPRLQTGQRCFECHTIEGRGGMQGWLVRSVEPPVSQHSRSRLVNDHTPLSERWGGWYVSGGAPPAEHLGRPVPETLRHYPAAGSDIGALTVLAHQAAMINLIAAVHRQAARAAEAPTELERRQPSIALDLRIAELADGLLFVGAAPLPTPLRAGPPFLAAFAARAADRRPAEALRELDLTTRLQRLRCSYMITSDAFRALDATIRQRVYRQMRARLNDSASGISASERQEVERALAEAVSEWPAAR